MKSRSLTAVSGPGWLRPTLGALALCVSLDFGCLDTGSAGGGSPQRDLGGTTGSGGATSSGGTSGSGGTVDLGVTGLDGASGGTSGSGGMADSGAPRDAGTGTSGSTSDAGGGGDVVRSSGCGKTPTLKNSPGKTINYNKITSGGQSRQYILRYPDNYDNNHPYRLILSYHWATGSASQVFDCNTESIKCYTTQSPFFGLWDLSNGSTIFVAPDGIGGLWTNSGGQDVTFTDDILKQVEDDLCIDTSRIELEGFSMGGAMANTLVCARPNVFRAAVAHSAGGQALPANCQPIPYLSSLGSQERGGQTSTADFFAKTNGCTVETLPQAPTGGHLCTPYRGCSAGHPVRWCPFDGGHSPSPRDTGQNTTWMPKEVWSFLTQF